MGAVVVMVVIEATEAAVVTRVTEDTEVVGMTVVIVVEETEVMAVVVATVVSEMMNITNELQNKKYTVTNSDT